MNAYEERIHKAVSFIDDRYSDQLTLTDLAEQASFSVYHFSRVFQLITGVSPMKYLKQVRLRAAVTLLKNSGKSVTEVAMESGFTSISTFNASFKEYFGTSPAGIKKNSKIPEVFSNLPGAYNYTDGHTLNKSLLRRVWKMNVTIKEFSPKKVAYSRHTGSYLDTAGNWQKLLLF